MVFPTLKTRSEEKKNYLSEKNTSTASQKSFSEVFEEAKEKEQTHSIHICTSGYTKNARPFYNLVNQREYI